MNPDPIITSPKLEIPAGLSGDRGLTATLRALALASGVSVCLIVLRTILSGRRQHWYLVGNLALAWLPLLFSLVVSKLNRAGGKHGWRLNSASLAWLIFFPNAPYIFTDLIHLMSRHRDHVWVDMILILLFAWTGLLLGFLSLSLMQSVVAEKMGTVTGWMFAVISISLAGFGIYLGRFLRWNSWDLLTNPLGPISVLAGWLAHPLANRTGILFASLSALFFFVAYITLHSLNPSRRLAGAHP